MQTRYLIIALCLALPMGASAQGAKVYKWTDENGNVHFGDSIPPQYAEQPKQVLNDQGVTVGHVDGRKSDEQLDAEQTARENAALREEQRRADQALLATYVTVDEIMLHRDRRVELFQAQARVTELYLQNAQRRLGELEEEASRFKPYSTDPDAPMIDNALRDDINETKTTIKRQLENLEQYRTSQEQVIARFEGDINRFKMLKGID
jgi:hypothetical protein